MDLRCLYLMPTARCNSTCEYCYVTPCVRTWPEAPQQVEQVLELFLSQAQRRGTENSFPQLRFLGGEPYLEQQRMLRWAERFLQEFPGALVVVNSNGTLINETACRAWQALPGRIQHVISLDGPQAVHDQRRPLAGNRGSYRKAVHGLGLLRNYNLPACCNMVLDAHNAPYLGEFFSCIKQELDMPHISVSLRSTPGVQPAPEEQLNLLLAAYREALPLDLEIGGHHRLLLAERIPALTCRAGETTLVVAPNGELYACQRFLATEDGLPLPASARDLEKAVFPCSGPCCSKQLSHPQLVAGLEAFYREHCPQYLQVRDLDRLLFGVLPR